MTEPRGESAPPVPLRVALAALLAPGPCDLCGDPLPGDTAGVVCPACWASLPAAAGARCRRCSLPLGAASACAACAVGPGDGAPCLESIVAAFDYAGGLPALHRRLKFRGAASLARPFAERMARAWRVRAPFPPALVVPVPADPLRLPPRRFAVPRLARLVARRLRRPCSRRALVKRRPTRPQTRRAAGRRREALLGTMTGRPELLSGRRVLLVDDVATTGATLREAARAARIAGAERVAALVLARTPPPGYL